MHLQGLLFGWAMQTGISSACGSKQTPDRLLSAGCRARHPSQRLLRAVAACLVNLVSGNTSGQDQVREQEGLQPAVQLLLLAGELGLSRGMMPTAAALVRALADGNAVNQELLGAAGAVVAVLDQLQVSLQ